MGNQWSTGLTAAAAHALRGGFDSDAEASPGISLACHDREGFSAYSMKIIRERQILRQNDGAASRVPHTARARSPGQSTRPSGNRLGRCINGMVGVTRTFILT
jgi:hypothetical protein